MAEQSSLFLQKHSSKFIWASPGVPVPIRSPEESDMWNFFSILVAAFQHSSLSHQNFVVGLGTTLLRKPNTGINMA